MTKHRRFFIDTGRIADGEVWIVGDTARQITNVLRLKVGDNVVLFDGSGSEHEACITAISKSGVSARIVRTSECLTEPKLKLTLAVCLPKGDKLDLIVQKCVELGISRMVLVSSQRTVTRLEPAKAAARLARWSTIAVEATEQSGRTAVPAIEGVLPYESIADEVRGHDMALLAWEDERQTSLRDALAKYRDGDSVLLIVGPEGGLAECEVELAREAGAECVSLGRRTLRCETAAIAGCAAILYQIEGEL